MLITRVVIRDIKALQERDDHFDLSLGGTSHAICLRGINGSGKTTYLRAITSVWELFRRWIRQRSKIRLPKSNILPEHGYIGIQLTGLPGPVSSLWVQYGNLSHAPRISGPVLHLGGGLIRKLSPTQTTKTDFGPFLSKNGLPSEIVFESISALQKISKEDEEDFAAFWEQRINSLQLAGLAETQPAPLPNMVYLGAEDRYIEALRSEDDLSEPAAEDAFRWLARYQPSRDKRQHIENSITALRLVNPGRFADIRDRIHSVLSGVELLDRSHGTSMRPLVRVANRAITTLDGLSAGERAAFIAIFTIARWMTPGGIVLIDEPELHQHLSLMRLNLSVLQEYVVNKMNGQLIVASHAPEVWEHFRHTNLLIDLDTSRVIDKGKQNG